MHHAHVQPGCVRARGWMVGKGTQVESAKIEWLVVNQYERRCGFLITLATTGLLVPKVLLKIVEFFGISFTMLPFPEFCLPQHRILI